MPTGPASAVVLRNLREEGLICGDHRLRHGACEEVVLLESEIAVLERAGIAVKVLRREFAGPPDGLSVETIGTGYESNYLDTAGIHAAYAALHAAFPGLSTYAALPESTSGYDGGVPGLGGPSPVNLFRITTTPAVFSKPALLVVAGLHAREWAPPLAALEFASQLLHNYSPGSSDPDVAAINNLVENLDILIIGAANPDGLNYSRHDEASWRKNRRPNAGFPGCPGVDLNRNFGIYWGQAGSTGDPCDQEIYHGPYAFSEPETRNIRSVVEQYPNILAAIDCHSFGEHFYRPQPGGGAYIAAEPVNPADDAIYTALETAMNAAVASVSPGKAYSTGTTSNHAGTFDEYVFFGHRIFGFEVEVGQDFQPPIAEALVSVQEAAAAMRAIGAETLTLAARSVTPATVVEVIDKSGSMIASGYVDATRSNAARLADLMSLNDSAGIVSFSSGAATELPLTPIVSAGEYGNARAAAAGIVFGGTTSIGAGLQQAAGLLPPPGQPRSLVLLSDGFENTAPLVHDVLPTLPAGVRVHTVALGLASDQALLQQIASATGGSYFFSPDEMGLFEIYNAIHSDVGDADMVLSEAVVLPASGDSAAQSRSFSRPLIIDCDADYAEISVAVHEAHAQADVLLECLSVPHADLRRIQRQVAPGYQVMRWRRPQPGVYNLRVSVIGGGTVTCTVGAWVRSPVRLELGRLEGRIAMGQPIDLPLKVVDGGRVLEDLSISAQALCPATSVAVLARQWKQDMRRLPRDSGPDRLPDVVNRALAVRSHIRAATGQDPFQCVRRKVNLIRPKTAERNPLFSVRVPTAATVDGTYNVRLRAQGRTARGCPFVRVGFRSVGVR